MFDTIVIRKPISDIPKQKLETALKNVLFKRIITDELNQDRTRLGKFENFSVMCSPTTLKLEGSLSKLLLRNNINVMTNDQIYKALMLLKKAFPGISILTGHLSRVDMAECFLLDHKPNDFFSCLLETPKLSRNASIHGVKYTSGKKELAFYDKTEEAFENPSTRTSLFVDGEKHHLLRIELRIKAQAKRLLMPNVSRLTPVHLLSKNLQYKIAQLWMQHYYSIFKRKQLLAYPAMKGWSDLKSHLAAEYVEINGVKNILLKTDEIALNNGWSTVTKSKVKRSLQNLYGRNVISYTDRIEGMNKKIERSEIYTEFFCENGKVLGLEPKPRFAISKA